MDRREDHRSGRRGLRILRVTPSLHRSPLVQDKSIQAIGGYVEEGIGGYSVILEKLDSCVLVGVEFEFIVWV